MQVLLVEDSAVYRKLIGDYLRDWGFSVQVAENGTKGWELLQQQSAPKLALLDWVLPDIDGIDLCQRIRQAGENREYVYIILLTGKDGRQNMLKAMQAGADDFLAKPFDAHELKARLKVGQRILTLQDDLIAARESMRRAATHDCLTGLMNRSETMNFLASELERAKRARTAVGVILADIDHFKDVNDSFGHLQGDEALREISTRLRSKLRVYDGIGRYGGEEFLLVLPGCTLESSLQRAEQLREFVCSKPVIFNGPVEKVITISMGIAISSGSGEKEIERLLNQADLGLYQAKRKGRNRVEHVLESAPANPRIRKHAAGK
jgi:diguanylate cyclase (GGDEF)-like protein